MFEESEAYLRSIEQDFVVEMLRLESGCITPDQAEKSRTLARNTLVAFMQSFGGELQDRYGEFDLADAAADLPHPSDSNELTGKKRERRAVRIILALLYELIELSKSDHTYKRISLADGVMTQEELFTFDFVRSLRARWATVRLVVDELRSSAAASWMEHLNELGSRSHLGDPMAICVAVRALRHYGPEVESQAKELAPRMDLDEAAAARTIERVRQLSSEIGAGSSSTSGAECIELSRMIFRAMVAGMASDKT